MKFLKTRALVAALLSVLLLSLALAGCASTPAPAAPGTPAPGTPAPKPAETLKFAVMAAGTQGGSWNTAAAKIAEMMTKHGPGTQVSTQPGAGGENMARIGRKETQMGFTYPNLAYDAYNGEKSFKDKKVENVRFMAALYPSYLHLVVPKDSPWTTVYDLKADLSKVKVAMDAPGSAAYAVGEAVLKALGSSPDELKKAGGTISPLSYGPGADAVQDGTLNLVPIHGPWPHASVLAVDKSVKFLTMDAAFAKKMAEVYRGMSPVTIPKGTYTAMTADYNTVGVYAILTAAAELPEQTAYDLTKAFWDNIVEFHGVASWAKTAELAGALKGSIIPVHPGAQKYYDEKGVKAQ